MDFDHTDPSVKVERVNQLVGKVSLDKVLAEIAKCDLVCANCHRLRTWQRAPARKTRRRREVLIALKSRPCMDCGGSFHFSQMDFDHVRGPKMGDVSQMHTHLRLILDEAAKCDVVCANCHRQRTQFHAKGLRRLPTQSTAAWQSHPNGPYHRSWHELVGTMPDREIARQYGIVPATICLYRQKIGMPPYKAPTAAPPGFREWHTLAGSLPDKDLAAQAGISPSTVHYYRQKMGIHKFQKDRTEA
jgi:hypothetical protein